MANLIEKNEDDAGIDLDRPEDLTDDEFFEEFEEENLTLKQKLLLIVSGVISFLLFVIFLFPFEDILRTYLLKKFDESGFTVDFKKMSLPFWGNKQIDSLYFLTPDNLEIKSEEIETDISIYQLYKNNLYGKVDAISFTLDTIDLILNMRKVSLDLHLSNIEKGFMATSGTINIQITDGKISRLPEFPMIGNLSGTKIKSIQLDIKKIGNKFQIEKGMFNLSIAKITLKGKLDYSGSLKTSPIEIEICPKLTPTFATEREDLDNTLKMIGKGSDPCIPIKGTLAQPQVPPDILTGGMGINKAPENPNENGAP
jgi:hypothetical protein